MLNRPLILGISGAAAVGVALGLTYFSGDDPGKETAAVLTTPQNDAGKPGEDPARAAPRPSVSAAVPRNDNVNRPKQSTKPLVKSAANVQTGSAATVGRPNPGKPVFVAPNKPTFDVVRVNPRGDAVIAGRAAPNAAVVVRDGKSEVGRATADSRGEWVVIPIKPLPRGSRELTLSAISKDGPALQSDQNVVIMVPGRKQEITTAGSSTVASGALAVLVPRDGKSGSVVIQKPSAARSVTPATTSGAAKSGSQVTIDSVDYDQAGNVTISGNSAPKAPLSIYIDNKHAGSGVSDRQGRWRVVPGGALTPGDYTLRVDNVGTGGKVLGRAETQFTRAKTATDLPNDNVVSVEPGNSLWRIARRVYGKGVQYSVIFDANREQIRDPDLIYPGQVFFVPHVN